MSLKPEQLRNEPFVVTNETGNSDGHRRHLVPDPRIVPPESPMWMTRCGLGWDDRKWYGVIPIAPADHIVWCEACLAVEGLRLTPPTDDLYQRAVREWIVQHSPFRDSSRRPVAASADDVRNIRFAVDYGYTGSDVTPPDDPWPAIRCEIKFGGRWHEREVAVDATPVEFVRECLAIVDELRIVAA